MKDLTKENMKVLRAAYEGKRILYKWKCSKENKWFEMVDFREWDFEGCEYKIDKSYPPKQKYPLGTLLVPIELEFFPSPMIYRVEQYDTKKETYILSNSISLKEDSFTDLGYTMTELQIDEQLALFEDSLWYWEYYNIKTNEWIMTIWKRMNLEKAKKIYNDTDIDNFRPIHSMGFALEK